MGLVHPVLYRTSSSFSLHDSSPEDVVHHTDNCGQGRKYHFRRIRTTAIRFQVKAAHDVSICLSTDDGEEPEDMYEIFIGAWEGGNYSGIRRQKEDDVCRVETPDIVSEEEFRSFWIKIQHGVIKVGRKGIKHPFMSYTDPELLLHVTWYGYCTGWGAEGDWIFADEEDDSSSSSSALSSSDSEAEEINNMEERPIQYKRPARWIPCKSGGYFPNHPVSGGEGADGEVYVGMARHENNYIVGMVVPSSESCFIPYGGDAIAKDEYFILCNPGSVTMAWEPCSGGKVPPGALNGGKDGDEILYIARVLVDGVVSVGKVHPSHGVAYVPYGGSEHSHRDYEVLCVRGIPVKM
ncbi:hypothetical protein SK128_019158 [Halocaridina rubra]|uniref:Farnesoic acid O-methyl transferase domain-containing protein n=1 Tax=Halocaridina rubra TaxID=373956 RepID=A0AAN9A6A6_HALRR